MRPLSSISLAFSILSIGATTLPSGAKAGFSADVVVPGRGERVVVDQAYVIADTSGSIETTDHFAAERELVQAFTAGMPGGSYVSGAVAFGGGERLQQALSQRRAQAVADYLMARGIARERLAVKGFGEVSPVAPNDTRENMYLNRRTELSVID